MLLSLNRKIEMIHSFLYKKTIQRQIIKPLTLIVNKHFLPFTSYLLPLTSYLLPLTSYLLPLTSYLLLKQLV